MKTLAGAAVPSRRLARQAARRALVRRWATGGAVLLLSIAALAAPQADTSASVLRQDCEAAPHYRVLQASQPLPESRGQMQALWLGTQHIVWPDLRAVAGVRFVLAHSAVGLLHIEPGEPVRGADGLLALELLPRWPAQVPAARWRHAAAGVHLRVPAAARGRVDELLRSQLVLVELDAAGRARRATALQHAAALDERYAAAERVPLGARPDAQATHFALWAPTARQVAVCRYAEGDAPALAAQAMQRSAASGVWTLRWPHAEAGTATSGAATANGTARPARHYTYLVDVHTPGLGLVRHRVTDPYSLALSADSWRSVAVDLDDPALAPAGWRTAPRPRRALTMTELVIYELHVRDFSITDATVSPAARGKYAAFAESGSDGMRHLRRLAAAGLTDVHLLPVFDFASVPERGCTTIEPHTLAGHGPASEAQQVAVMAQAQSDCFNWGYDPLHFNAPEGSYASDAARPEARIVEFRRMVMALEASGLRVGMDMVYNHTSASGHAPRSVLDRIVPGYYHRLDAQGQVEKSTCCENTATEHRMMARLMIDSAVSWVRHYRISSMRFDLMGHQPREAMLRLQRAVNRAAGQHVHLIGEGWNFGEVKDGARFVQAAQGRLEGSGIATFSDRGRDAARGGGCCDSGTDALARQGWLNGLHYAPNELALAHLPAGERDVQALARAADLVRLGLAGTLSDYRFTTFDGRVKRGAEIDYAGQRAGYARAPGEVVNYVENHDNPTLFDLNAMKLPAGTSREDRARVQVLGMALTAFSQGVPYFHAGIEALRSKSLDRNSFDSGDWFNRMDWTFNDNFFATGLPPKSENGAMWALMRPLLEDTRIKPTAREIAFTRDAFMDLLRLRASSSLFRLADAKAVQQRLRLLDTGPAQAPGVVLVHLLGRGLPAARFGEMLVALNVLPQAQTLTLPTLQGKALRLHPVHLAAGAADARPKEEARWEPLPGRLTLPARTALVYVLD